MNQSETSGSSSSSSDESYVELFDRETIEDESLETSNTPQNMMENVIFDNGSSRQEEMQQQMEPEAGAAASKAPQYRGLSVIGQLIEERNRQKTRKGKGRKKRMHIWTPKHKPVHTSAQSNPVRVRSKSVFHDEWLNPPNPEKQEQLWPRWRGWLAQVPGNPHSAYCGFCKNEIALGACTNGAMVTRHTRTLKHVRAIRELASKDGDGSVGTGQAMIENGDSPTMGQRGLAGTSSRKRNTSSDVANNNNGTSEATSSTNAKRSRRPNDVQMAAVGLVPVGTSSLTSTAQEMNRQEASVEPAQSTIPKNADRLERQRHAGMSDGAGTSRGQQQSAPRGAAGSYHHTSLPRAQSPEVINVDEDEEEPNGAVGNHRSNSLQQPHPIVRRGPSVMPITSAAAQRGMVQGASATPSIISTSTMNTSQGSPTTQTLKSQLVEVKDKYINVLETNAQLVATNAQLTEQLNGVVGENNELASQLEAWRLRYQELEERFLSMPGTSAGHTDSKNVFI